MSFGLRIVTLYQLYIGTHNKYLVVRLYNKYSHFLLFIYIILIVDTKQHKQI